MDNLPPEMPPFQKFSHPSYDNDDDRRALIIKWAVRVGAALLIFALGIGSAKVLLSGGAGGHGKGQAAASGNGLTAPNPFVGRGGDGAAAYGSAAGAGGGDSLSMIKHSADDAAYDSRQANAGAGQNGAGSPGGSGPGGAGSDGAANGANGGDGAGGAGQGGGQDGQANGRGGGPGDGQGGGYGSGAHLAAGFAGGGAGGAAGGAQSSAFAANSGQYKGGGMNRLVAAPNAGHRVVGAGGGGQQAMGRRMMNSGGAFGNSRTLSPTATTVSTPPPPQSAPPSVVSNGGASAGGGAGTQGNPQSNNQQQQQQPPPNPGPTNNNNNSGGNGGSDTKTKPPIESDPQPKCFVAGTKVATPDGPRAIETIRPGELIYAVDPATFELVPRRVVQAHHHAPGPLYRVAFSNGLTLLTTKEHRFYDAAAHDYRAAQWLRPGDRVVELRPAAETVGAALPFAPPARLLPEEAALRAAAGSPGRVAAVARELTVTASAALDREAPTYNLTVEGYDLSNYLAEGVLVHNHKCYPDEPCGQPGGGGGGCFAGGTPVLTPGGERAIETIRPGDMVYSVDPDSRRLVPQRVFAGPFPHQGENLYELTLADGTRLRATSHHPFFDPRTGEYKAVGELSAGDEVLAYDGPGGVESVGLPMPVVPAARGDLFAPVAPALAPVAVAARWRAARIASIAPLPGSQPVYDLLLEGPYHNFLAGGVLVHNPTGARSN